MGELSMFHVEHSEKTGHGKHGGITDEREFFNLISVLIRELSVSSVSRNLFTDFQQ